MDDGLNPVKASALTPVVFVDLCCLSAEEEEEGKKKKPQSKQQKDLNRRQLDRFITVKVSGY